MVKHFMIDLETLGTVPGSAFTQIGWCVFEAHAEKEADVIVKSGNLRVELQSALDAGLTVDASTIQWWLEQSEGARASMVNERGAVSVETALTQLANGWKTVGCEYVWAKPPAFDIAILDVGYRTVLGGNAPWPHWKVRCLRTLLHMCPNVKQAEPELAHDAESDAIAQAITAWRCIRDGIARTK